MSAASAPDSKPPSSFDAPMKMLFTAPTRPRSSSGVRIWTSVLRTTTLTLSAAPSTRSAASDSGNDFESPKTIVARPKATTAVSSVRPARSSGPRCAW
jgi:hypothetical protein